MKTTLFLLVSLAVVFSLALFYNYSDKMMPETADPRDKMFSTLVDNEAYRTEFMEVLQAKYPADIMTSAFAISNDNREMQSEMINQLVAMCYTDPNMSHMMMGMTMNMCDIDKDMCSRMSQMMMNHRSTMECMMKMMYNEGIIDKKCMEQAVENMQVEEDNSFNP